MSQDKMEPAQNYIDLAYDILRKVQGGKEPYAASVLPMASALHELARDPRFILAAADDLLDEAMCYTRSKLHMDVSGDPCGSVRDAYAKLKAARNV